MAWIDEKMPTCRNLQKCPEICKNFSFGPDFNNWRWSPNWFLKPIMMILGLFGSFEAISTKFWCASGEKLDFPRKMQKIWNK